ncbi:MAG: hypothetical protein GY866_15445 [Proteobacteria bacterium]|nr:hypothetical protein [Pseudomonadota bacterium]
MKPIPTKRYKVKWLEIIHIRIGGNKFESLVEELTKMLSDLERNTDTPHFSFFRHSSLSSDFSLHLSHESETKPVGKSKTGLRLASTLREFGLVDHATWIMEKGDSHRI